MSRTNPDAQSITSGIAEIKTSNSEGPMATQNINRAKGMCAPAFSKTCKNRDRLHAWVKHYLDINIPRQPICATHAAPFDYLASVYFEPSEDVVVWAPRGGGKTRLGAIATLLDLLHKPKCSIRILGGSMEQSLKMWEHLQSDLELLKEKVGSDINFTLGARRVEMENGSYAAVLSQSEKAVRGLRVQKLRCDEVELFEPEIWQAAQLVTRSRKKLNEEHGPELIHGVVEVFSTLHRPYGMMQKITDAAKARGTKVFQWCLLEVLERCPSERDCNTCQLLPECQQRAKHANGFFPIDDAIAMKGRVSIDTWETEMLCLRPAIRGCVYPTFKPEIHVRETVGSCAGSELWLGIDFGFSNPFVSLWIRKYADGAVHVIDEYVQQAQTIDTHIAELRSRTDHGQVAQIACDPAGGAANDQTSKSNVDLLRKSGFSVRTRSSRIVEGLELVRLALKSGTGKVSLFIHPRCTRLIKAMQAYRYPDQADEIPLKDGEHDHLVDALRYFFVNATISHKCQARRY
jgi:hypothetical protein